MNIRKSLPADRDSLLDIWLRSVRATHRDRQVACQINCLWHKESYSVN
jgi:hypothetical protein